MLKGVHSPGSEQCEPPFFHFSSFQGHHGLGKRGCVEFEHVDPRPAQGRRHARRGIGLSLLTLRIVPPVVILIPVYLLMLDLHLLDTWLGLVITYTAFNITFCVWMMESFFREIPVDLEEAAMVDGDSRFTAFRRIALPLAAPGLAATAVFAVTPLSIRAMQRASFSGASVSLPGCAAGSLLLGWRAIFRVGKA